MTERPMAEQPATPDPLTRLADAGFPVEALAEEEQAVLAGLTPAETELLLGIKQRLDAAEPEVRAHGEIAGGALF
ncbi:aroma-sacti cluster domain-containing protein [Streptomyces sp. YIM 98790]|uniref:aroma-sacti cluster domain-containing protein n=1 Tax=Streptomyces sp. YIM 98790 TaxID=2689077 RepID=UPI00140C7F82|nr:aroma-sacti cluster domain-containing protein [Streptomyces sp. YIM 98790]